MATTTKTTSKTTTNTSAAVASNAAKYGANFVAPTASAPYGSYSATPATPTTTKSTGTSSLPQYDAQGGFTSGGKYYAPNSIQAQNSRNISGAIPPSPIPPAPINKIDTSQPNPQTVNQTPNNMGLVDTLNSQGLPSDFNSRAKLAATNGIANYTGTADQNTQLAKKYQTGHANAVASGGQPPSAGNGPAVVSPFVPPAEPTAPDTSVIDTALANDPGYQKLLADKKAYDDIVNQKVSLVDEYKQMISEAGIPAINAELINTKNIIDGTEDDIRNEVTKAGGFATDSQVLAMSNARNKVLIKNYNNLLDTKQSLMDNITTMIGLAKEDHTTALQSAAQKLEIDQKILDYSDKMKTNAVNSYQKIIDNVGYDGLYSMTKGDPYYTGLIEKTLGLGSGGLAKLASRPNLDLQIKEATLTGKQLENQKLGLEVSALKSPSSKGMGYNTEGKPLTSSQATAVGYATRLVQAKSALDKLDTKFASTPQADISLFGMNLVPNVLKSKDRQQYDQAKRNFVNAVLRRESGAAIAPSEFESAEKQYFASYGDSPDTLAQKKANRDLVIRNFMREGGQGEVDASRITVAPDGSLIQITD